jgi:hypothetical protein
VLTNVAKLVGFATNNLLRTIKPMRVAEISRKNGRFSRGLLLTIDMAIAS